MVTRSISFDSLTVLTWKLNASKHSQSTASQLLSFSAQCTTTHHSLQGVPQQESLLSTNSPFWFSYDLFRFGDEMGMDLGFDLGYDMEMDDPGLARSCLTRPCSKESRRSRRQGTRTLLGAPGLTTRSKKLLGAPGHTTRNKKLLETRNI